MAKKSFDLVNYGALGAGSVAAGIVGKFVPVQNQQVKAAVPVLAGYFLSRMKQEPLKFLGYGMISRGVSDLASSFGIGEEMIAESLGAEDSMNEELIAAELEEELIAAELDENTVSGQF